MRALSTPNYNNKELEPFLLLELPEDTLYHLLTIASLEEVLRLRRVLGKQRPGVFQQIEYFFAKKYHLPGLSLDVIHSLVTNEVEDEAAIEALSRGDYPEFISSLADRLDDRWEVLEEAMKDGRQQSALVLLQHKSQEDNIPLAIRYRCGECLRYLTTKHDFESALVHHLFVNDFYLPEKGVIWALKAAKPKLSEHFLNEFLAHTEVVSPKLLQAILERMSDEEVEKAYRVHQQAERSGLSLFGGDYFHGEEVSRAFLERLAL